MSFANSHDHDRRRVFHWVVLAIFCSAIVWSGPARAYAHEFDPAIVLAEGVLLARRGETTIVNLTDPTGCAAIITARVQNPTVATVSPVGPLEAVSQPFTVTAQTSTPSETYVTITWEGVGVNAEGNPCEEKEFRWFDVFITGGPVSGACAGTYSDGALEFNIERSGADLSGTFTSSALNAEGTIVGGVDNEDLCWIALFIVDHPQLCTLAIAGKLEDITEDDSTFGRFEFGGGMGCEGPFPPFSIDLPKTASAGAGVIPEGPGAVPTAATAMPINLGETVTGELTPADATSSVQTSSFADSYTFEGTAGQSVTIALNGSFDTFLVLLGPDGDVVTTDDDGGPGLNSLIQNFALPASGTYTIEVTSFTRTTGTYELSLSGS